MSNLLVVAGSLCMSVTLGLSWYLVGVPTSAFMKSLFASYPNLLKAVTAQFFVKLSYAVQR